VNVCLSVLKDFLVPFLCHSICVLQVSVERGKQEACAGVQTGLGSRTNYVLSGSGLSVLSVWNRVESGSVDNMEAPCMQITRMQADNGVIVGLFIPPSALQALSSELGHNARMDVTLYDQNPTSCFGRLD
jgi:hypothetical protein